MKNKPLVSLIIPVYNDAEFLHESLDSAINQTLKNIEIICVNDGSTDNSLEIMNEYAAKDSRVRVINRTENGSALMARKDGIAAANGDFTMFLDGDDSLVPNACETAYNLIVKNDVDILQFSFISYHCAKDGNILYTIVRNPSFDEMILGRDRIQNFYFLENQANLDSYLWNKIYKTKLLTRSHSKIDNFNCFFLNDLYEYYYILYYAKNMIGISTEPLYTYYRGRGVTGDNKISLKQFEKLCQANQAVNRIKKFLEHEGIFEEQKKYLSVWRKKRVQHYYHIGCKRLKAEDFDQAVKIMYSYFNEKDDAEEITLNLLTQLRNHVDWNKNLAASKIQIEDKNARIKELQDWNAEQLKAKEWFLSQIANKDACIAELQKNLSLANKIRRAVKKIFSKIFKEK